MMRELSSLAHWIFQKKISKNLSEENIFPFQESADATFNSALIYELCVLKTYAEPLLFSVPKNAPEYQEAKRLLKFFEAAASASENGTSVRKRMKAVADIEATDRISPCQAGKMLLKWHMASKINGRGCQP